MVTREFGVFVAVLVIAIGVSLGWIAGQVLANKLGLR